MEEMNNIVVEKNNDNKITEEFCDGTITYDKNSEELTYEDDSGAVAFENRYNELLSESGEACEYNGKSSIKNIGEFADAIKNSSVESPIEDKINSIKAEQAVVEKNKEATTPEEISDGITHKKRGRKKSSASKVKAPTITDLNDAIRDKLAEAVTKVMIDMYGECLKVVPYDDSVSAKKFSLASPCVDSEGNEKWVKVDITIPHGNHTAKEYDGYDMNKRFIDNVNAKALSDSIKASDKTYKYLVEKTRLSESLEYIVGAQDNSSYST